MQTNNIIAIRLDYSLMQKANVGFSSIRKIHVCLKSFGVSPVCSITVRYKAGPGFNLTSVTWLRSYPSGLNCRKKLMCHIVLILWVSVLTLDFNYQCYSVTGLKAVPCMNRTNDQFALIKNCIGSSITCDWNVTCCIPLSNQWYSFHFIIDFLSHFNIHFQHKILHKI